MVKLGWSEVLRTWTKRVRWSCATGSRKTASLILVETSRLALAIEVVNGTAAAEEGEEGNPDDGQ